MVTIINKIIVELWKSDKYIPFFGLRFYYKPFFMMKIAKPLGLKIYQRYRLSKNQRRRKRKKENGYPKSAWVQKKRKLVIQRDGGKCRACNSTENLTLDHIIPLCILGKAANNMNNLQILCMSCNGKKSVQDNKLCTNFKNI